MSRNNKKEKRAPTVYILIFILLAAGIASVGYFSYRNFEQQFRLQAERQLSSIAELKMNGLVNWRMERLADVKKFYQNPSFASLVQAYLENPQNTDAQAQIQDWLKGYKAYNEYDQVRLLDAQGQTRLSASEGLAPISSAVAESIPEVLQTKQVMMVDFYSRGSDGQPRLSLLTPILDARTGDQVIGFVSISTDPQVYLYPFINEWPVESASAETLLVRRDGDNVLFLNELRFDPNAALTLQFPLTNTDLPAVKAALGQSGVVEGMDYRDKTVLADVRAVPGSPWFMVSKMDIAEVYAPLRARLWQTILFFGTLILAVGVGLTLIWRQQQVHFYRWQVEAAEALIVSETRYRRLFEAARDGILILDANTGVIIDVNPFLVEMLGFPQEEFVGKELWELGFFKDIAANKDNFLELQQKEYIRYEDLPLETADGRKFHVEFVSNVYQVNHHKVIQCNIRDITERKQAEDALRESEQRLQFVLQGSQLGYWDWNLETNEVKRNERWAEMLGYHLSDIEFTVKQWIDFIHPDDQAMAQQSIQDHIEGRTPLHRLEYRMCTKDGQYKWILDQAQVVKRDSNQRAIRMSGTHTDISERKLAEKELLFKDELLHMTSEMAKIGGWEFDTQTKEGTWTDEVARIHDLIPGDPTNVQLGVSFYVPDSRRKIEQAMQEAIESAQPYDLELQMVSAKGKQKWVRTMGIPIVENGKVIKLQGIFQDITERKQAEVAQKQSELLFRALFELSPDAVVLLDPHGSNSSSPIVDCNAAACLMSGYGRDELIGQPIDIVNADPYTQGGQTAYLKKLRDAGNLKYEVFHRRKNGVVFPVEVSTAIIKVGERELVIGIDRDITERKQAEDELRKNQMQLQAIMDYSPALISIKDLDGNIILANQGLSVLDAPPLNEMIGKNVFDVFPKEVAEQLWNNDLAALQANAPVRSEEVVRHKDGTWHTYWTVKFPIYLQSDQPFGICAISNDITERKQAEDALRESEDKFKYVFEYSVVGKSITQFNGGMQVNKALCDMLGYSPQEMQDKKWQEITHPNDIELTQKEIATLLSGEKESVRFEKRFLHKNGQVVWVDLSSTIRRDEQRKPLYLMSAVIDITERKHAEEKLRETNEYLNNLINYANAPIIVWDPQFRITRFNEASENLTGRSVADVLGKPLGILFPPTLIQVSTKLFKETLSGKRLEGIEVSIQHVDGSIRTVMWNSATLFSTDGATPIATISQGLDITERKRAENALRESEEKYRSLVQGLQVGVVVHAPDSSILFSNSRASELLGLTPDQMRGKPAMDPVWRFIREDGTRMPLEEYPVNQALAANIPISNLILGVLRTDRKGPTWLQCNAHQDRDLSGNLQQVVISFADITERKQAEDVILQEKNFNQAAINSLPGLFYLFDEQGHYLRWNKNYEEVSGYSAEEIARMSPLDYFNEPDKSSISAAIQQVFTTGQVVVEGNFTSKDQTQTPHFFTGQLVWLEGRRCLIGMGIDISARKRVEAQLAERHATLNAILESSTEPVFSLDRSYRYTGFNNAHVAMMKALYKAEIEIGKSMFDYMSVSEDREKAQRNLDRALNGEQIIESAYSGEAGGVRHYFEITHNPIREVGGEVIGVSVFVSDISERKRVEEALQEYNNRLETEVAERTRELRETQEQLVRQERLATLGQLAGSIGHELRNPLGVISNATYFLKMTQPNASEKVREYLDIIEKETRTSDKIVTDLLDFTRIKSLDRQPVSVSELIRQALERNPAPESVETELEIPADLPQIYVDPQHVIQIFGNLVSNAFQSMVPESGVSTGSTTSVANGRKLTVSVVVESAMIKVNIQDMGVGIPLENMKKLFEPLFTTKIKGIGLGLAVSRKLAEANGGRIEAESEAGKGSTFTVYLPIYEESK